MSAKDLGPLDWRTPIVDAGGRPSPEFQRRWNTQRANNGLIGAVATGSGPPTGTPAEGAAYVNTSATPPVLYIGHSGAWVKEGVFDFVQLADAPNSYSGAAGNLVQVNAGATGLQFAPAASLVANPTATAGPTAVNGAATTFMRSDAAPAVQLGSASQKGIVQVDGTTITASGGVISAVGGGGGGGAHKYEAFGALPLAATFSHYNWQTGTSLTDAATSLMFNIPGQSGFNFQVAYVAAPVTPYNVYLRAKWLGWSGSSRGGLTLFNSSTKRMLSLQWGGANTISVVDDTGPSTFNSQSSIFSTNSGINWLRWSNNGTTLIPFVSADGLNWMQVSSGFTASTYAPDSIGLSGDNTNNTAEPSALWVGSFGTTAPS